MSEHRLDELLALGAAGALTADEQRELDRLLAADPAASREFADLQVAASVLAEAASEPPPAHLRERVLDTAATEAQPGVEKSHGGGTPVNAPVVPIHRRRWMIPATAVAAAAILLVGGLVIERIADAPTSDELSAVLDDPRAITVELTGSIGQLQLVKSPSENATVLMGHGITAPDSDHEFQLWAIHDGEMADMGTFMPTTTGDVMMMMDGVSPPDTEYAVTIEPMGGSEEPTGDHVADSMRA
jgi:anti-sigma-K factor RskA